MDTFFWILFIVLFLIPFRKKPNRKDDVEDLSTPEYMRRYRFYGDKICESVEREMDYSKILKKPYKTPKSSQPKPKKEKSIKEEDTFGDLWIL